MEIELGGQASLAGDLIGRSRRQRRVIGSTLNGDDPPNGDHMVLYVGDIMKDLIRITSILPVQFGKMEKEEIFSQPPKEVVNAGKRERMEGY